MAVPYTASYNTSSAYDFSAYETAKPDKGAAGAKRLRVVRMPRQFISSLITPRTLAFFALTVTVVCLMVYNNAQLNEITREMNTLSSGLEEMKTEYVKMHSQKESLISPRSVAETAEYELGLKRMDKYQTVYIYLNHEDKIELAGEAPDVGLLEKAKAFFISAISSVQEYISG